MVGQNHFCFLNETHEVQNQSSWNDPKLDKLWLYNLHYFDDLNAKDSNDRKEWHRSLIERWINENEVGNGNGWEPYPISLRIINWIKWALDGNRLQPGWVYSLTMQTRWLRQRLEWHLLGNHLFSNAKALFFAGAFFTGQEAQEWLTKGMHIISNEIHEQVLSDGGHFERSPMYHALCLEDVLDLINLSETYKEYRTQEWHDLCGVLKEVADRMFNWLDLMCHPDGEVPFFNDSNIGIAPAPSDLHAYAQRLSLSTKNRDSRSIQYLDRSGYLRIEKGPIVALLDAAPVGPDYLPGHAHADTLSFECSLFGRRLVVNSGTSVYGTGAERTWQRSTAAHSTVTVNGENSSEVWSGFRVARRAYPIDLNYHEKEDMLCVSCAHDGYRRLKGKPVHRREWHLFQDRLIVRDSIEGGFSQASARYYFHPDISLSCEDSGNKGMLWGKDDIRIQWQVKNGKGNVISSSYFPSFGLSIPNHCLEVEFSGNKSEVIFSWENNAHSISN
ncbi:heparinase II/III family protein [Desulfatibacillum aliphaticivorans]|nr:heparinase II/III family protein [Desulfatibacillum aliphaticivorans]